MPRRGLTSRSARPVLRHQRLARPLNARAAISPRRRDGIPYKPPSWVKNHTGITTTRGNTTATAIFADKLHFGGGRQSRWRTNSNLRRGGKRSKIGPLALSHGARFSTNETATRFSMSSSPEAIAALRISGIDPPSPNQRLGRVLRRTASSLQTVRAAGDRRSCRGGVRRGLARTLGSQPPTSLRAFPP